MRKEEIYSFILNLMKRIEYSRESEFNKINKILFLTLYYNIFECKYDEVIKDNGENKEQLKTFIDNFFVEEDKNIEELLEESEFKKIQEKGILKYREAKESIENIKKDKLQDEESEKIDEEKGKENEENKIETDKFKKVEENNILKYKEAKAEVEIMKETNSKVESENNVEKQSDDLELREEFKKIEEKDILKYKEAKESIENIKKDKQQDEKSEKTDEQRGKAGEESKIETDKFRKVEENNILKYKEAKAEVEIMKETNSKVESENNVEKQSNDLELKGQFKKIEEKDILSYKEVKDEIKKIQEEKIDLKNAEKIKERKIEEPDFNETEPNKIEEKDIFTYKESKELIENIKDSVQIEDKKDINIVEQEDKFKKVEEKSIFKYADAKSEIDNIKDETVNVKNEINEEELKEDNLLINKDENKFHKIEEKNINDNISARKEIEEITKKNKELKKKYKLEVGEYQQITNNIKTIIETKCHTRNIMSKESINIDDKIASKSNPSKIKAFVKISDTVINEMLYGKVKFLKPIIKIIDIRGYVTFKNINLVKNSYKPNCKDSILMYDGTVRIDLQYLEGTKIHCSNIDAVPKYYLMYIPFSGTKSVIIDDEQFLNEKVIKDKISFDMKSSEFAYDTVLQEDRCIGPYAKVYEECEVFIILECAMDILMKKIIEH